MKKIFLKNLIIFFTLVLASCIAKKDQQPQIRIVDLQGKSRSVHTKVPELNVQAMAAQGKIAPDSNPYLVTPNSASANQQNAAQNNSDFGAFSSNAIEQTLQPNSQEAAAQNQNVEVAQNNSLINQSDSSEEKVVQYDLSKSEEKPLEKKVETKKSTNSTAKKSSKKSSSVATSSKGVFVQVGSFSVFSNATKSLARMKKFNKGFIEKVEGDKTIYRVLLGPFPNKTKASTMVQKIKKSGHDAIVVRNR